MLGQRLAMSRVQRLYKHYKMHNIAWNSAKHNVFPDQQTIFRAVRVRNFFGNGNTSFCVQLCSDQKPGGYSRWANYWPVTSPPPSHWHSTHPHMTPTCYVMGVYNSMGVPQFMGVYKCMGVDKSVGGACFCIGALCKSMAGHIAVVTEYSSRHSAMFLYHAAIFLLCLAAMFSAMFC